MLTFFYNLPWTYYQNSALICRSIETPMKARLSKHFYLNPGLHDNLLHPGYYLKENAFETSAQVD